MSFDVGSAFLLVRAVAFLTAIALIVRPRFSPVLVRGVVVVACVFIVFMLYSLFALAGVNPHVGIDYRFFRGAGFDVLAGRDPYSAEGFAEHPFLNPPTALPLFAVFALLPFKGGYIGWTILNLLACASLVPLAQWALAAQQRLGDSNASEVGAEESLREVNVLGLTAALLISDASVLTLGIGQLSIVVALALFAALAAQARGRPVVAGIFLGLATVKVGTMLPFLLLFCRKADRWTWVMLGGTTLVLCLATGAATALPGRLATVLTRINQLESPGQVNDYTFEGFHSQNILGFDHAFYRLGLRNRTAIRVAQYGALLLLGGWVARKVLVRSQLPRPAACSLVALYSMVFFYHRNYDAVILALPLVYAANQAGRARPGPLPPPGLRYLAVTGALPQPGRHARHHAILAGGGRLGATCAGDCAALRDLAHRASHGAPRQRSPPRERIMTPNPIVSGTLRAVPRF